MSFFGNGGAVVVEEEEEEETKPSGYRDDFPYLPVLFYTRALLFLFYIHACQFIYLP